MSVNNLEMCGSLLGAAGLLGTVILEWASIQPLGLSPLAVGMVGCVAMAGCYGLALAFRDV